MDKPEIIKGGISVDGRGAVSFVNNFDFPGIKRFYAVENHSVGFVRAWHGHKSEDKYFLVLKGTMMVCGVKIDNWDNPSKKLEAHRFVLSEINPAVLHIPAGYANGMMALSDNSKLIVFSNSSLENSRSDDYKFPPRYWDPWKIEER